jgi:hypothetical protein
MLLIFFVEIIPKPRAIDICLSIHKKKAQTRSLGQGLRVMFQMPVTSILRYAQLIRRNLLIETPNTKIQILHKINLYKVT